MGSGACYCKCLAVLFVIRFVQVHLQMIYFGREYCVAKGHEVREIIIVLVCCHLVLSAEQRLSNLLLDS
jgi:endonuclease III